jgi:hypothetical protein
LPDASGTIALTSNINYPVTSVFGRTGAVVAASGDYTTTQVTEGTNLYYTEARVNANTNVAANTAARHNAVTIGTANGLSLSTQALSLALASTSTNGALSSTDWNTFNGKQAALNGTGFVKISGTTISYDNSTYLTTSAAASTYLPLSGGTLTGALNGTSAVFSGSVTASQFIATDVESGVSANYYGTYSGGSTPLSFLYGSTGSVTWNNGGVKMTLTSAGALQLASSLSGTIASFSNNGLFGGSNNAGNAATYTISVGLAGTNTGGIQLWSPTNSAHYIQFGDGISGADNYRGYIGYNHATDLLNIGTASADKLVITSGGNVGIGTSSPHTLLTISGPASTVYGINLGTQTPSWPSVSRYIGIGNSNGSIAANSGFSGVEFGGPDSAEEGYLAFHTHDNLVASGERMRITKGGDVLIGTTTASYGFFVKDKTAGFIFVGRAMGSSIFQADNNVYNSIVVYSTGADGYNGAGTAIILGRNTSTGRSINAGGTINALGTDYAEYMTKAIDDNIAKGDIVGVDGNGLLTNVFADSISFVVKSTDPSFVGGDAWGSVDDIGKLPNDATDKQKAEHESKLEAARIKVDRIAFSGQIPCNVYDAKVGDYIIPIELNGKISGQAISNPTFEQYQLSVGKVWKIMEDGRAWIAVKIG